MYISISGYIIPTVLSTCQQIRFCSCSVLFISVCVDLISVCSITVKNFEIHFIRMKVSVFIKVD